MPPKRWQLIERFRAWRRRRRERAAAATRAPELAASAAAAQAQAGPVPPLANHAAAVNVYASRIRGDGRQFLSTFAQPQPAAWPITSAGVGQHNAVVSNPLLGSPRQQSSEAYGAAPARPAYSAAPANPAQSNLTYSAAPARPAQSSSTYGAVPTRPAYAVPPASYAPSPVPSAPGSPRPRNQYDDAFGNPLQ